MIRFALEEIFFSKKRRAGFLHYEFGGNQDGQRRSTVQAREDLSRYFWKEAPQEG